MERYQPQKRIFDNKFYHVVVLIIYDYTVNFIKYILLIIPKLIYINYTQGINEFTLSV